MLLVDICVVRSSLYIPEISDHVLMVIEQNRNVLCHLGCWVERDCLMRYMNYIEHISVVLLDLLLEKSFAVKHLFQHLVTRAF